MVRSRCANIDFGTPPKSGKQASRVQRDDDIEEATRQKRQSYGSGVNSEELSKVKGIIKTSVTSRLGVKIKNRDEAEAMAQEAFGALVGQLRQYYGDDVSRDNWSRVIYEMTGQNGKEILKDEIKGNRNLSTGRGQIRKNRPAAKYFMDLIKKGGTGPWNKNQRKQQQQKRKPEKKASPDEESDLMKQIEKLGEFEKKEEQKKEKSKSESPPSPDEESESDPLDGSKKQPVDIEKIERLRAEQERREQERQKAKERKREESKRGFRHDYREAKYQRPSRYALTQAMKNQIKFKTKIKC